MRGIVVVAGAMLAAASPASSATGCMSQREAVHAAAAAVRSDHVQLGKDLRVQRVDAIMLARVQRWIIHVRGAESINASRAHQANRWIAAHCNGHGAHAERLECGAKHAWLARLAARNDAQREHQAVLEARAATLRDEMAAAAADEALMRDQLAADQARLADAKQALAACRGSAG